MLGHELEAKAHTMRAENRKNAWSQADMFHAFLIAMQCFIALVIIML